MAPGAVQPLEPAARAVRFGGPVPDHAMQFVRFGDIWQREDYGFVDRDGVTAEVVLLSADAGNTVALDYRLTTETALGTFTRIAAVPVTWEPAEPVPGWSRRLFYRRFALADPDPSCVGFAGSWGVITEDPEQRPRHAMFGYVCMPLTTPLTQEEAEAIVRAIRVDTAAAWRPNGAADGAGADGQETGLHYKVEQQNSSFPLRLARFYVVGNGRSGFN